MEQIVYVDVLLAVNFTINYLLLSASAKLIPTKFSPARGMWSAVVGAISAMSIFLPNKGVFWQLLIKLITAVIMVLVAFTYRGKKHLIIRILALFLVSFIFSGFMLGIWLFMPVNGIIYYNGIVYFDISAMALIVFSSIAYGIITIVERILIKIKPKDNYYKVQLKHSGKTLSLRGYVDSGNNLTEPFSGYPVMIITLEKILPLLTAKEIKVIVNREKNTLENLRIIPYQTVSAESIMYGIRPESIKVYDNKEAYELEKVYIGIVDRDISMEEVDILLSSSMNLTREYIRNKKLPSRV